MVEQAIIHDQLLNRLMEQNTASVSIIDLALKSVIFYNTHDNYLTLFGGKSLS